PGARVAQQRDRSVDQAMARGVAGAPAAGDRAPLRAQRHRRCDARATRGRAWRHPRARSPDPGRSARKVAWPVARARIVARRTVVARAERESAMPGTRGSLPLTAGLPRKRDARDPGFATA